MIVVPLNARKIRRTLVHRVSRLTLYVVTRTSLLTIFACFAGVLFLTSLGNKPPPSALIHASEGVTPRQSDISKCGCERADQCGVSVPVGSFAPPVLPAVESLAAGSAEQTNLKRLLSIRHAIKLAWAAYARDAWGADELHPVSRRGSNTFGGLGATIVEALGTLYIAGLDEEYGRAREWVQKELRFDRVNASVSVHETTTRVLGGLVSAFQLTGDNMFLRKAEDLAARLSVAFTSLNGVPFPSCKIGASALACSGSGSGDGGVSVSTGYHQGCAVREGQTACEGLTTTQNEAGGISMELRAVGFHSLRADVRELRCKADRAVQAVVESGPQLLRDEITGSLLRAQGGVGASSISEEYEKERGGGSGNGNPGGEGEGEGEGEQNEKNSAGSSVFFGSWAPSFRLTSMNSYYASLVELWQSTIPVLGAGPRIDTTATFGGAGRGFYEYLAKGWRQGGQCESYLQFPLEASLHMLLRRAMFQSPTGELYLKNFDAAVSGTGGIDEDSGAGSRDANATATAAATTETTTTGRTGTRNATAGADGKAGRLAGAKTGDIVVHDEMCYLAGMFESARRASGDADGNGSGNENGEEGQAGLLWGSVAEDMAQTCAASYRRFPERVGARSARYNGHVWVPEGAYRLNAEVVEALLHVWRASGEQRYRDEAWRLFTQMHHRCRVGAQGAQGGAEAEAEAVAFTVLEEQKVGVISRGDLMPSGFIGGTLKMLFLTFAPVETLPHAQWVLNRAGHPLLVTPGLGALNWCAGR